MKFSNTYTSLGEQFFQRVSPEKVTAPKLLLWNDKLAASLFISNEMQEDHPLLSELFSGNKLIDGSEPIALAYSGHQFGHFNPQLGDGRAHLLGEIQDKGNTLRDIQLKGSGQTAFSRRGDGKCALAPALREYIMSEAMSALGVPTSRCLAVVSTGEIINRGIAKTGAVVTRVASSHIRVGTFQYFAARGDLASLKSLLDYSIERHFPEINTLKLSEEQRILTFLERVIDKQITLIVNWLRVGFIHGVMNTDNTAIFGETIDFGPCAMMGRYDEKAVFSSIDEYGRYAFGNQGKISQWNMARLADCLLFLLSECQAEVNDETSSEKMQQQQALEKIEVVIHQFTEKFDKSYYTMYMNKLGMGEMNSDIKLLIDDLLSLMQAQGLDYIQTFHRLTQSLIDTEKAEEAKAELGSWYEAWMLALEKSTLSPQHNNIEKAHTLMTKNNPVVIPRNHHMEAILTRCENAIEGESSLEHTKDVMDSIVGNFIEVLRSPYHELENTLNYQDTSQDNDQYYQTFCGT